MLDPKESLSRKFITKWAWLYAFVFITAPLGYVMRIILTWELTPEEIGIIYGTISLLALVGVYTDFWLTESLNYFLPKYLIKNDYARSKYLLLFTLIAQVSTSTLVSFWLYFWASFLAQEYFHTLHAQPVIQIFSFYFIGGHILQVISTFFNAIQNVKLQKSIELFRMIMTVWGALILLFSGNGNIETYSWIWILWLYFWLILWCFIFYFSYYKVYLTLPIKKDLILRKDLIHYSLWTLFSANVSTVLHQLDMQFVTYFLWVYDTGIYSIYLALVGIPFIFLWPLIGFLYPVISEIWGRSELEKIKTIYSIFSTHLSIIMLWISGIFFLIGWDIVTLLFWEKFIESGIALAFIAPFLFLNVLIQINFQILWWLGYVKKRIKVLIWTVLFSVPVSLICILGYKYHSIPFPSGSAAASFAVGISWVLLWVLSYRAVREYAHWFLWWIFSRNFIIVWILSILLTLFPFYKNIHMGFSGRFISLPAIWFVLLGSLIIFLVVNFRQIKQFMQTIRNVRNWNL